MKKLLAEVLIVIVLFLMITGIHTYFHEQIHRSICSSFGGESNTYYSPLFQGAATECTTSEGREYHILNEIIGYNVSIILFTIFIILIFFLVRSHRNRFEH